LKADTCQCMWFLRVSLQFNYIYLLLWKPQFNLWAIQFTVYLLSFLLHLSIFFLKYFMLFVLSAIKRWRTFCWQCWRWYASQCWVWSWSISWQRWGKDIWSANTWRKQRAAGVNSVFVFSENCTFATWIKHIDFIVIFTAIGYTQIMHPCPTTLNIVPLHKKRPNICHTTHIFCHQIALKSVIILVNYTDVDIYVANIFPSSIVWLRKWGGTSASRDENGQMDV